VAEIKPLLLWSEPRRIGYNPICTGRDLGKGPPGAPLGEVAEWLNAAVSKTVWPCKRSRGFESPPLRLGKPKICLCEPGPAARFLRVRWQVHVKVGGKLC
jgi:hypothetical protein